MKTWRLIGFDFFSAKWKQHGEWSKKRILYTRKICLLPHLIEKLMCSDRKRSSIKRLRRSENLIRVVLVIFLLVKHYGRKKIMKSSKKMVEEAKDENL